MEALRTPEVTLVHSPVLLAPSLLPAPLALHGPAFRHGLAAQFLRVAPEEFGQGLDDLMDIASEAIR